jgi:hypothetical protein
VFDVRDALEAKVGGVESASSRASLARPSVSEGGPGSPRRPQATKARSPTPINTSAARDFTSRHQATSQVAVAHLCNVRGSQTPCPGDLPEALGNQVDVERHLNDLRADDHSDLHARAREVGLHARRHVDALGSWVVLIDVPPVHVSVHML